MVKKVLIVDDDEKLRELVREYLEGYDFQIITLPDGSAVLKTIEEKSKVILPSRSSPERTAWRR